jgi:hypothetical protein
MGLRPLNMAVPASLRSPALLAGPVLTITASA